MAIRRSIKKRKRIWHHRVYGSIENPPLNDHGIHGMWWPSDSTVLVKHLPRFKGSDVVVGWICYLEGPKMFGLWLPTFLGIATPFRMSGEIPPPPKGKRYLDTKKAEPGSYEFHSIEPNLPWHRLLDKLVDAFEEKHGVML